MCMYRHLETQTQKVQAQLIKIVKLATYHAYKKKKTTQPKVKIEVLKQQKIKENKQINKQENEKTKFEPLPEH